LPAGDDAGAGSTKAAATFEGEFSDLTRSCAGKGLLRYAW
jgi:hypothetical protein